jgi:hypothetical protein
MKTFQIATLLAGASLSAASDDDMGPAPVGAASNAPVYVIKGISKVRMPHRRVRGAHARADQAIEAAARPRALRKAVG